MKKILSFSAVLVASALVLAGCASKPDVINVGSDIPYAPMEMFDANNKPIGFDVDLAYAIGKKLGKKVVFEKQAFDTLIPSLQSGKHDLAMSSMSDTTDRQKKLDFVDYFNGGASILVAKGNPSNIHAIGDLCGKPVAAESATWEVDLLKSTGDDCVKAGKQTVTTLALPSDTDAQNAVRSGKAVAYLADSQLAAYTVKVAGDGQYFELVTDPANPYGYESGLIGIGILKGSPLTADVQKAMQSLMDDGTYDALLKKWNLESFKINKATLNGTK
jgi:polar amino acid transport system substrate-binding protein